jgi:galactokinase
MMEKRMEEQFNKRFQAIPKLFRSPGRINIIGEHTDYNDGFVLPAAIDKAIYIAAGSRKDEVIELYSAEFNESCRIAISSLAKTGQHWANYILGVVDELLRRGYAVSGFNMIVDGDLPIGAGLSSSAAVECATVFALNDLFQLQLSKLEMVTIAQKAEHNFAGLQCGIMDMFASMFGRKDHAIKLDCRSLQYDYVPLKLEGMKIVLLNTNVKHSLASSEYNTRRKQCEQGVAWINEKYPEVTSLRQASEKMLDECVVPKDKIVAMRCRYIIQEIQRVQVACEALKKNDFVTLGRQLFATHQGLSKSYGVSCNELDYLVNAVQNHPAVIGARMMGGGFGGCTINLVKEESIASLVAQVSKQYEEATQLPLSAYVVEIENGTSAVDNKALQLLNS